MKANIHPEVKECTVTCACGEVFTVKSTKSERTQAGLGSERQKQAVDEALDSVNHALEVSCADFTMDAVVQDLEDALSFLSEITGETTPDDILGNIFANFCVGK